MNDLQLLDVVALKRDLLKEGLLEGQVGTIVEILDNDVFLVEFADTDGRAYAMLELTNVDLMALHYAPMQAA